MCNPIVTLINSVNAHSKININKPLVLYTDIISRTRRSPFTRGSSYLSWLPSERQGLSNILQLNLPVLGRPQQRVYGLYNHQQWEFVAFPSFRSPENRSRFRSWKGLDGSSVLKFPYFLIQCRPIHILNLLVAMLAPVAKLGIPRRIGWYDHPNSWVIRWNHPSTMTSNPEISQ